MRRIPGYRHDGVQECYHKEINEFKKKNIFIIIVGIFLGEHESLHQLVLRDESWC